MSEWNRFQQSVAGQGMSRAEVSAAYAARNSGGGGGGGGSSSRSSSSYATPSYSRPAYSAPPPAPTPTRAAPASSSSSSRAPSQWNQFQRDNAGQGLSQSDMAALYRASSNARATASSSSSSSTPPPPRQPTPVNSTTNASSSSWNQFQRDNAGQGLSRTQMASNYRANQAASSTSGSTPQHPPASASAKRSAAADAATRRAAAAEAATARAAASATPAQTTSKRATAAPSTWNEFQRQHAGQGFSKRQLSLLYKERNGSTTTATNASSTTVSRAAARSTTTSHTHNATTTTTSDKPARRPNAFNEFQKQYKKDHPNEKLSAPQLARLYREQQDESLRSTHNERLADRLARRIAEMNALQDDSGFGGYEHDGYGGYEHDSFGGYDHNAFDHAPDAHGPTNAFDLATEDFIAEKRQALEQFMLEIAMVLEQLREQASVPTEEVEALTRVAQALEAEEGNLNRKAFVKDHEEEFVIALSLEDPLAHRKRVAALRQCAVIDTSRLQLTMDDASQMGSGGYGAVYSALLDDTTPVAVKVIDGVSTKAKERFEQELLAMMKASAHENVLRVLGYSVFDDNAGRKSFGIVMELMGGGDLSYALHHDETATLSESDLLRHLVQVIKAIEYIHSQGITHRDIKPHNVLLSCDLQTAKLADFGLAGFKNTTLSTRQSQAGDAATGAMGLTPAYAAPEVIDGQLSFRDTAWKKSDVFSFTVLLTEMLMREQPWECETPQFIMHAVSKQQKRPFDEAQLQLAGGSSATVTTKLRSLVCDGWHQDPSMRPTATEMRERLETIVADVDNASRTAKHDARARARASSSPRGVDAVTTVYNGDVFFDAGGH